MSKKSLLDCTLRDGGYLNDWRFGENNIVSIFERLVDAKTDIIEIGFLDERRPFDKDRTIYPNTQSVDKFFDGVEKNQSLVVGMIDYGTCAIENIACCNNSFLDGIRIIFKKNNMYPAMEYCRSVKSLGYKVFSQLVSITSYSDEELLEVINLVNDVKPFCVSIVDTYGLLDDEQLLHYYRILEENIDLSISIGFHGHNNFQLAYSNALTFLKHQGNHDIIVDGTLYGMGKSAGNSPLELIAMTLNDKYEGYYKIGSMLESINESIMDFYKNSTWGYNTFYYLCAKNKCHPNYLTDINKEENLSISSADQLLKTINPFDKKLIYDKEIGSAFYKEFEQINYQEKDVVKNFLETINNRAVLLLGPGKNIILQKEVVDSLIEKLKPYIVSINFIPDHFTPDCVFITNPKRYRDMTIGLKSKRVEGIKKLATTNIACRNGNFDFVINRSPLLEKDESIIDNSFLMLLNFIERTGIKEVYCAGFDGYSEKDNNYFIPEMEYSFIKDEATRINSHTKKRIDQFRKQLSIKFITYSAYDVEEDINGASI